MKLDPLPLSLRLWLDRAERVVITLFFGWLLYRFSGGLREEPANVIFLISEGMIAAFVLFRRSTDQITVNPMDWVVATAGTLLPMLVQPVGQGWDAAAGLLLAGLIISVAAKLSLRRSFGIVAANRGIKRSGLYAVVRHPMYLGYFFTYAGFLILNPSVWNAGLLSIWAALQIGRIRAEERVLMDDSLYRSHAEQVRFRLLPYVY